MLFIMLGKVGAADEMWHTWFAFSQSPRYTTLDSVRRTSIARIYIYKALKYHVHIAWQIMNMTEVEYLSLPLRYQRRMLSAPEWPTSDPAERVKLTARHLDITVGLENALSVNWNGEAYEEADPVTETSFVAYEALVRERKLASILLQYQEVKEALAKMTWLPGNILNYAKLTDSELAAKAQENALPSDHFSKSTVSDVVSFAESSPEPQDVRSDEVPLSTTVPKSEVLAAPDDSSSMVRIVRSGPPLDNNVPLKRIIHQSQQTIRRVRQTTTRPWYEWSKVFLR